MNDVNTFREVVQNQRINIYKSFNKSFLINYLIKHKLPRTIKYDDWVILIESGDFGFIWKFLLKHKEEKSYNYVIAIKVFLKYYKFYSKDSEIEKAVYADKSVYEVASLRIKTLELCLKDLFNDMIKKDIDILNDGSQLKPLWAGINLDSLYFVELDHLNYTNLLSKKKNFESKKVFKLKINAHMVVLTISKLKNVIFYTRLKNKERSIAYPEELVANVEFTKGYLLCFSPHLVSLLKQFKYDRKLIQRSPIIVSCLKKKITFEESLDNSNFSSPIWMNERGINSTLIKEGFSYKKDGSARLKLKEGSVSIIEENVNVIQPSGVIVSGSQYVDFPLLDDGNGCYFDKNKKIYVKNNVVYKKNGLIFNHKLLKKKINLKTPISVLNFLNSIELTHDRSLFSTFKKILDNCSDISNSLSSRHSVKNHIIKISEKKFSESGFTEGDKNLKSLISSASVLELIDNQLQYYTSFYLDHRLDWRLRIYCYPWPINYQLHHIVRCSLLFKNKPNPNLAWELFTENKLIKRYIKDLDIFEYSKNLKIKESLDHLFDVKKITSNTNIEDKLKKEFFFQTLLKIAPSTIKELTKKIEFSLSVLNDFTDSDMEKDWKLWSTRLGFSEKKLPYLLTYQKDLKNALANEFDGIFWADASNNAIQLIALRLKIKNESLLKLINIFDNDTEYSNIYEYMTEAIKKKDHFEILQQKIKGEVDKIGDLVSEKDINSLQEIDLNKYLLMPSAYGMGFVSYRDNLNKMLNKDERREVWNRLNLNHKNALSDYFWKSAVSELKKKGFDMNQYKKFCKIFWENTDYVAFVWKNDLGLPVAPISFIENDRNDLLKKERSLILEIKETDDKKLLENLNEKYENLKKKLKKNEDFWKRYSIETEEHKIFARLYYKESYEICARDTRQSLVPNTIHAADACVMHLSVQICKKIGIEVLVIHDSIGCHPLVLPLVKSVFKVSNLLILELNNGRDVFPLPPLTSMNEKELDEFFKKILESKNFFK